MNSEIIIFLVYIIHKFHVHAAQPKWMVAMEDKCVFTVSKNWTILFEKNPSLFVTYIKKDNFHDCRTACCSHQTCNGYVFDGSNQADSCKLLKCSRNGTDCKKALQKYERAVPGEVGFITGLAGATVNHTTSEPTTRSNVVGHEAPIAIQNEVVPPEVPQVNAVRKANPMHGELDSSTTQDHLSPDVYLLPDTNRDQLMSEPTSRITPQGEDVDNFTQSLSNFMDPYQDDIKEHTNSISLTIAFVFGMAFLVTVFYLTGKRWVEGIKDRQRKGYTRINYLLNGV